MTKQEKLKKIAKRMKISESELKRLKKASPFKEYEKYGTTSGHKKIHDKNFQKSPIGSKAEEKHLNLMIESSPKSSYEKEFGLREGILKDGSAWKPRLGSRKNPLKKKPKKK
jgi:hypothetical protein